MLKWPQWTKFENTQKVWIKQVPIGQICEKKATLHTKFFFLSHKIPNDHIEANFYQALYWPKNSRNWKSFKARLGFFLTQIIIYCIRTYTALRSNYIFDHSCKLNNLNLILPKLEQKLVKKTCVHVHKQWHKKIGSTVQTYCPFHKTLPKSSFQMHWTSVRFYEMVVTSRQTKEWKEDGHTDLLPLLYR